MEFLLEQRAQFSADIQLLGEAQAQTIEIVGRLANGTLEGFKAVNAKIDVLVNSQIQIDEKINALADSQAQTDEKINLLVDSQMRTGEDLRNLIGVVDRHLSEGRNRN